MPRDAWGELRKFMSDARADAVESVLSGALNPQTYAATCKKISTIDEIANKMTDLLGSAAAPGEDI